jgi:hypothetical protein
VRAGTARLMVAGFTAAGSVTLIGVTCDRGCSVRWTGGSTGPRYDAERMVTAFAGRLKDDGDVDVVEADLVSMVQQALEPAHVSLWTNRPG